MAQEDDDRIVYRSQSDYGDRVKITFRWSDVDCRYNPQRIKLNHMKLVFADEENKVGGFVDRQCTVAYMPSICTIIVKRYPDRLFICNITYDSDNEISDITSYDLKPSKPKTYGWRNDYELDD